MDLYRYFHPHHNPRLRHIPIRLQELAELMQAAIELRNAFKRAGVRSESSKIPEISKEAFNNLADTLTVTINSIQSLIQAHPGDSIETFRALFEERSKAPGWENWARILGQRLEQLDVEELINSQKTLFDFQDPKKTGTE